MMKLSDDQLNALRAGLKAGYLEQAHGLESAHLVRPRFLDDDVRGTRVPTGDYELTGWGNVVAANYQRGIERLPVGTLINHRIHAYKRGTVVLSDDSGELCTVAHKQPLCVEPGSYGGSWDIPLTGGGKTPGSAKEAWFLRNLLDMDIELDLGEYGSADDFRTD